MDKDFRWGLIGPGRIAERFATALNAPGCGKLVAIASRELSRAQAFAANHAPGATSYGNYHALLTQADVDAIYIATPHNFHFEQTKACLSAGFNVLVEKPCTTSAKQARELCQLARDKGLLFMEAMWSRSLPSYAKVKSLLREGAIGELELIQGAMSFLPERVSTNRLFNPALAGGALLDIGVYPLSLTQHILSNSQGQCPEATIQASATLGETGIDETTLMTLTFNTHTNHQVHAQLACSINTAMDRRLKLYGNRGHLEIGPRFWGAQYCTLYRDQDPQRFDFPVDINGFEYQIREAQRCVRIGASESPLISHAASSQVMHWCDQIRQQIKLRYPFDDVQEVQVP